MSSQAAWSTGASEPGGDVRPSGHRAHAGGSAGLDAPATAAAMAAAARGLRGAVTGEQAYVLNPGFDDFDLGSPRGQWTYPPELERPGLPLRAMSDLQRKLAHELITASVSMEGYAKVISVMAMEHVRRALMLASAPERAHPFDPERYCFRISDAERSALAYVRSGPRGIGGADLTAARLSALVDLLSATFGHSLHEQ
jgi:hypothetical protein